jgi:delta14-sterol reductase/lamin-B receptor
LFVSRALLLPHPSCCRTHPAAATCRNLLQPCRNFRSVKLSTSVLVVICMLKCMGYAAFRGSNGEKDAFRRDPTSPAVAHLQTIQTKTGRKLLVSGWWGLARKINYVADWTMGVAW